MKNQGFTLVEVIAVIVVLSILVIIASSGMLKSSDNTKKKLLENKVYEIEKVAITYGQDNRMDFDENCNINGTNYECITIKVKNLVDKNFSITSREYMNSDDNNGNIINPYNNKSLNNCEIQVYKKYGKIYAIWKNKVGDCWYE